MINKVILQGKIVKEPHTKYINNKIMCECMIAHTHKHNSNTFIEIVFWGAKGESFMKDSNKGDMVIVVGEIKLNQWHEDDKLVKRHKIIGESYEIFATPKPIDKCITTLKVLATYDK